MAVTQQIDLSGAVGRMVASVLFGLAEIESEYRRERQAAGIAVAKERGVIAAGSGARPRRHRGVPGNSAAAASRSGDRHRLGRQPTDGLPVPGHAGGVVTP